ncbi:Panacea domain-containing protein [Devosia ureilytica]|uniref:Panacea domain-containing protein n=1 Tax=Devosia ureilytica TaxID=2952754 RepID=UPI0038CDC4E8
MLDQASLARLDIYSTSLLKILYFAHGWHLAKFSVPLIAQPFEAWEFGPVVRVVYDQIREYSGSPIKCRLVSFNAVTMKKEVAQVDVQEDSSALIRAVTGAYGVLHPYRLSDLTHAVDSPWTSVWDAANAGKAPGAKLSDCAIRDYFLRQNEADVLGIS